MGRKPTTNKEKVQRGTNQPYRMKKETEEPQLKTLSRMPVVPDYICPMGQRIWRETGPKLLEAGLLTDNEIFAFGRYCHYMGLYMRLMGELNEEEIIVTLPNGVDVPNPKWKMANDCQDRADRLGKQFGLSPSTRKDVPAKQEKREHPLAALMLRKG